MNDWIRWFAWYPVYSTISGKIMFLKYVQRTPKWYSNDEFDFKDAWLGWEYKEMPKNRRKNHER